ncbi:MAG: VTT domain-containing protein [Myxococcota bacterium]
MTEGIESRMATGGGAWLEAGMDPLGFGLADQAEPIKGLMLALATLILEDPATVSGGLLVADGRIGFWTAYAALCVGIAAGDLGLYGLGRWFGPRVKRFKWVDEAGWERASAWLDRRLIMAVVGSRFIPGARLPTYVAAGALKMSFLRFAGLAILASTVWATLLLVLTVRLGEAFLPHLGGFKWAAFGVVLAAAILPSLAGRLSRRALAGTSRVHAGGAATPVMRSLEAEGPSNTPDKIRSLFEFWPPVLFYVPVAFKYAQLALWYRGATLPTATNPSIYAGGLIRESKSQILDLIPEAHRNHVPRYISWTPPSDETALTEAKRRLESAAIVYPFVAKPDQGQRGAGVRLIQNEEELAAYLASFPRGAKLMFQQLVNHPMEAGIFYYRDPKTDEGTILSVTLKEFPEVVGDGVSTLEALIERHPRARFMAPRYKQRWSGQLTCVLAEGEKRPLVFSGNHCQGAVFRDGAAIVTDRLRSMVDELARAIPGFYFGRFDIRFRNLAALERGEDFGIVELNGAGAEVTHIWDPNMRLVDAYRALFRQFELAFEIGAKNRAAGVRPLGSWTLVRELYAYFRLAQAYPPSS